MEQELIERLIILFGIKNLLKVCRLKELNNQLETEEGLSKSDYDEHEKLLKELEYVFPQF